jgi:hypothetical protein
VTSYLTRSAASLGRPVSRLAIVAAAAGALALVLAVGLGSARVALAVLDASWLFFAGLAAGSVAVAAAIRITHGAWARPVLPVAEAGVGFFAPAFALLAVLALASGALLPEPEALAGRALSVVRQLVPTAVLFVLGSRLVAEGRRAGAAEGRVRAFALAYLFAYAVTLSLWAYDLVMRLWDSPPVTVIPPYYFLGAFLSGLAWVGLVAAARGLSGPDLRHDMGKLLFAIVLVWSYLLWALFLPTWYGNVPEEVAPLLLRWQGGWRWATVFTLVAVFAWPFWLLFSERLKRRRGTLAAGAGAILIGLWTERFLLVLPSVALAPGAETWLVGAGVAAGVAGLFLLAVGGRMPPRGEEPARG